MEKNLLIGGQIFENIETIEVFDENNEPVIFSEGVATVSGENFAYGYKSFTKGDFYVQDLLFEPTGFAIMVCPDDTQMYEGGSGKPSLTCAIYDKKNSKLMRGRPTETKWKFLANKTPSSLAQVGTLSNGKGYFALKSSTENKLYAFISGKYFWCAWA